MYFLTIGGPIPLFWIRDSDLSHIFYLQRKYPSLYTWIRPRVFAAQDSLRLGFGTALFLTAKDDAGRRRYWLLVPLLIAFPFLPSLEPYFALYMMTRPKFKPQLAPTASLKSQQDGSEITQRNP